MDANEVLQRQNITETGLVHAEEEQHYVLPVNIERLISSTNVSEQSEAVSEEADKTLIERNMDDLVRSFSDAFGRLPVEAKKKYTPIASYVSNVLYERDAMKALVRELESRPAARDADQRREQIAQIDEVKRKVEYVENQRAITLDMITDIMEGYKPDQTVGGDIKGEHVITAVTSLLTDFGDVSSVRFTDADLDAVVLRTDAVKAMLVKPEARHEFQTDNAVERVKQLKKRLVDDSAPKLNQEDDRERAEREAHLAERSRVFDMMTSHDETNVYAMFAIPKIKDKEAFTLDREERALMDEASIRMWLFVSACDQVIENEHDTIWGQLAGNFKDTVTSFSGIMFKYSYDAQETAGKILSDRKLSGQEKEDRLEGIRKRMVAYSERHGLVCARMTETINKIRLLRRRDTATRDDEIKLQEVAELAKKCGTANPGMDALVGMEVDLSASDERVDKALTVLDDLHRFAGGIFDENLNLKMYDEENGSNTGDDFLLDGRRISKYLGSVLHVAGMQNRTRVRNIALHESEIPLEENRQEEKPVTETAATLSNAVKNKSVEKMGSKMSQLAGKLEKHIPAKEMEKLGDFYVDGTKHEGVGKCRAWWIRRGHVSDGQLKKAIDTHVERMLQSDDLTDQDMAEAAANIVASTGLSDSKVMGKKKTLLNERLTLVKQLSDSKEDAEIVRLSSSIIKMFRQEETELSLKDAYFTKYPQALKTVLLYKLVSGAAPAGTDKVSAEVKDRLEAARHGISRLYQTLTASEDYQNALAAQKSLALSVKTFNDSDVNALVAKHRDDTMVAYKQRVEQTTEAKNVVDEQLLQRSKDKTKNGRVVGSLIKANYERMLRRAAELPAVEENIGDIVRKPAELPAYVQRVGAGAVDDLLKLHLKDMLISRFAAEKMDALYEADQNMLVKQVKVYAGMSGDKLSRMTLEQFLEFCARVSVRLAEYPKFLTSLCEQMKDAGVDDPSKMTTDQRKFVLQELLSGKALKAEDTAVVLLIMKDRHEFLEKNREALLFGGNEVVVGRFRQDLTKLKLNSRGKIRAGQRQLRMQEVDDEVKNVCAAAAVEAPMTFYAFAVVKKLAAKGQLSEESLVDAYKDYIKKEWYASVKAKDTAKGKPLEKLSNDLFKEAHFKYYGVLAYGAPALDALGTFETKKGEETTLHDVLNDTERSDFEKYLSSRMLTNIVDKEVVARKYCEEHHVEFTENFGRQLACVYSNEKFEHKMRKAVRGLEKRDDAEMTYLLEQRDRRLRSLSAQGFDMLLPILMESKHFTDHLFMDLDEEFADFTEKHMARAAEVVKEIEKHPYGDQYVIGKKKEILKYILSDAKKSKDAKAYLDLETYDKQIESTVLGKTLFGKQITLGDKISEAINKRTKQGTGEVAKQAIGMEEGTLYTMALLYDGVDAALSDEKMDSYRKRTKANTLALDKALEQILAEKAASGKVYDEGRLTAIRASFRQREREKMFTTDEKTYADIVMTRAREWFAENEKDEAADEVQKSQRVIMEENMVGFLNAKKRGRLAFADMHQEIENMRRINGDLERKATADQEYAARIEKMPEKAKEVLDTFIATEKKNLPKNGALNSIYNETLVRMSFHVLRMNKEALEYELMLDYNTFANVKNFYFIAEEYIKNHPLTKKLDEGARTAIGTGLMEYYGEMLLDPSYLVTGDVIRRELDQIFDEKKVGRELVNLLQHESGGIYSVGSEGYDYSSSPLSSVTKENFEKKLAEGAGEDKLLKKQLEEYGKLDEETKLLAAHLLVRESEIEVPGAAFIRAYRGEEKITGDRSKLILSYLKGERLLAVDYGQALRSMTVGGALSGESLQAAISLASDIHKMREEDGLAVDKKTYATLLDETHSEVAETVKKEEDLIAAAEEAAKVYDSLKPDIRRKKDRPNSDKLWNYYCALRVFKTEIVEYAGEYDAFIRRISDESIKLIAAEKDPEKKKEIKEASRVKARRHYRLKKVYDDFIRLEDYATLLRNKQEIQKEEPSSEKDEKLRLTREKMQAIERHFKSDLGLNALTAEAAREEFSDFLDNAAYRVDGFKTKSTIKRYDKDEEAFPEEVKKAVYAIDRWVAANGNSFAKGNSESTFAAEILGHPMRERLFAYYMVENKRLEHPTGTDMSMCVNGYVPNLEKFKDAVEIPFYKLHWHIVAAIKDTETVRDSEILSGVLANYGSINLDMIESAIRLLDDDELEVSKQLENLKDALKTDYSDVIAHHPKDKELKQYLLAKQDRQEKLKSLMAEVEKLRSLAQIAEDAIINKAGKTEDAQRQALVVQSHFTMLLAADKELLKYEERAAKDPTLAENLRNEIGRRLPVTPEEEESDAQKRASRAETIDSITGYLKTADGLLFKSGIFTTPAGVTALSKVVMTCFMVNDDDPQTVNEKMNAAMTVLDTLSDAAEPVAEMIQTIVGSSSEVFGTVAGAVAGAATAVSGAIGATQAQMNKNTVEEGSKKAAKKAKEMQKAAEKEGRAKVIRARRELSRATHHVARMQTNKYVSRRNQQAISATGGAVAMSTALIPGIDVFGAIAGGICTAAGLIHGFYASGANKEDVFDTFLGMNELYKKYQSLNGKMKYEATEEADAKKLIRSMMLRKFHFSSMDQFFADLAKKYAQILYNQIFFKEDGKQVLASDTEEIAARAGFVALFPEKQFTWPADDKTAPVPCVDELADDLMKVS